MRKVLLSVTSVLAMAIAGAGVANAKTIVYCSEGSPEGFNPQHYTAGTTFDATSRAVFDRLAMFKIGTTQVEPGLAEKWDISEDGKTYTFHLRKGVKWHTTKTFKPTRDFNADDVLFTFNRQWKKDHPYHGVGGSYEYFESMSFPDLLESIEKVDDYTVVFKLKRPEAPMIANLAMDFASILSAEYADQMSKAGTPEKVDQEPVGTGPWQFVGYQKDAQIRYEKNKNYWKAGLPKEDKLVFQITPDASVRYAKLKAGECHVMAFPNPADLAAMKTDANITLMNQPGLNIGYLGFNVEKKPFDDKKVRQALNMATNKDAIIEAVYQGAGVKAKNPIPPTIWSYNNDTKDYAYDPEGAKKLLAEAGVTSLKTDIWAMPVQRPYNPNARRMAEMIQADWKKVGVEAEIVSFEWGEYLKRTKAGEQSTFMLGWTGDNGDPDNFLAVLLGCDAVGSANRSRWCNKDFEDLIQKAKVESDVAKRTALYEQAQKIFKEEAPWITVAHSVVYQPVRKEVQGWKIDPLGGQYFQEMSLSK